MKNKFHYFLIGCLFIPAIAGYLLSEFDLINGPKDFYISVFLFYFSIWLLITGQGLYIIKFYKAVKKISILFIANALIPLILISFAFIEYIIYMFNHNPIHFQFKPVSDKTFDLYQFVIKMLLIHTTLTFFFINNTYIKWKINKGDIETRQELVKNILMPMKAIVRYLWMLVVIFLITSVAHDSIRIKLLQIR